VTIHTLTFHTGANVDANQFASISISSCFEMPAGTAIEVCGLARDLATRLIRRRRERLVLNKLIPVKGTVWASPHHALESQSTQLHPTLRKQSFSGE
jgi:hypothetical protein